MCRTTYLRQIEPVEFEHHSQFTRPDATQLDGRVASRRRCGLALTRVGRYSAPIDRVFVVVGEMVTGHDRHEPRRDAVFIEDRPTPTRCVADGGYPAPDMTLHIAGRDVTNAFAFSQRLQFAAAATDDDVGDAGGALRPLRYVTERQHDALRLSVDDDGSTIDCVATVAGLAANRTSARVTVHCELAAA